MKDDDQKPGKHRKRETVGKASVPKKSGPAAHACSCCGKRSTRNPDKCQACIGAGCNGGRCKAG